MNCDGHIMPSISFQTFLFRHLKYRGFLKIQYIITIHLMR